MKKSRILVVDDEQSIIESYHQILDTTKNRSQSNFHQSAAAVFSIEDSEPIEELHLEDDPFEIMDAYSGLEAIEAVKKARDEDNPISLVFLDMRMPPGIDGRETAKQIRKMDQLIEIVIMTAYSDYSLSEIVEEVGTEERLLYLKKPFSAEQIEQLASYLTNRWHTENSLSRDQDGKLVLEEPISIFLTKAPETIGQWIEYVKAMDGVWKKHADRVYEEKMDLKNPDYLQYNQLRYYVHRYVLNSLQETAEQSIEEQEEYLKLMVPFNSVDDFNLMISHFFFIRYVSESETGKFSFFRDPYVQECFILSDLLKVRKTIEIIEWIIKGLNEGRSFQSSIPSDEEKAVILKSCRRVMKMIFIQCIRTEYQNQIYKEINPDFITIESIQNRKKERIEYSWEGILKGERYRRIFLHMVFRNFIETEVRGKHLEIEYDFLRFEQLKREFFTEWLIRLGDNPVKKSLIKKLKEEKKLLLKQMLEEELLRKLNTNDFDDLVAEINSKLPAELQSPVEPLSTKHGTLKNVKANLLEIKEAINKEAFSTTSVERMPDVLKGLSSIADQDAAKSLLRMFKSTIAKEGGKTDEEIPDFEYWMTGFAMSGPINMLIVVPPQFIDLYTPILKKALEKADIGAYQIMSVNNLTHYHLSNNNIVVFFRVPALEVLQEVEIYVEELIGVDLYSFQVDRSKVIRRFVKDTDNKAHSEILYRIHNQIEQQESQKQSDKLLKDPYAVFEENWMAGTVTSSSEHSEGNVDYFLTQLVGLIKWTIMEGLVAAGHLQSLTTTLASIDKVLIVFPGMQNPFKQLANTVQTPKNWVVWGEPAFDRFARTLPNLKTLDIETIFDRYLLSDYDMVLVLDLNSATAEQFLMHMGIKEPFSIIQKSDRNQIFCINLVQVFTYQRFLERCNYILNKYDPDTAKVSLTKDSFWKLIEDTRYFLQRNFEVSDVKKGKIKTRWTNTETLEQDLINRISQRMEFFYQCYRGRQPQ